MNFGLNEEQKMMIDTIRRFIAEELQPLEEEVENSGALDPVKAKAIFEKSKSLGLYF
jgi:acyl-CoA dehydrogenase